MKCPACEYELSQRTVSGITVDVCDGGCGGIWFDGFELQKVDEPHEAAGEALLDIPRDPQIHVDQEKRRSCPKCQNVVMMRHFASIRREVELDECPRCGGFWLDAGELRKIRTQYKTDEDRSKAAKNLFAEITEKGFADMHAQSRERMEHREKMAKMFRFVCPSYYIPGDQNWGAF